MSLVTIIYTVDTVWGLLYTFYFSYTWFNHGDTEKRDMAVPPGGYTQEIPNDSSQSASPARELFLILSSTIIFTGMRFYFNLLIISFTRLLIKQNRNESGQSLNDEEQEIFQSKSYLNMIKKSIFELEIKLRDFLLDLFS